MQELTLRISPRDHPARLLNGTGALRMTYKMLVYMPYLLLGGMFLVTSE